MKKLCIWPLYVIFKNSNQLLIFEVIETPAAGILVVAKISVLRGTSISTSSQPNIMSLQRRPISLLLVVQQHRETFARLMMLLPPFLSLLCLVVQEQLSILLHRKVLTRLMSLLSLFLFLLRL